MCLSPLSSVCLPYFNPSNQSTMGEDEAIRQPLINTAQNNRSSATKDQLLYYMEEQLDPTGYFECGLSFSSFIMAVFVVCLHSLENNHENHEEILGTQLFNQILMTIVFVKRILSCSSFSINWSKKTAKWLRAKRLSEQGIATNNLSTTQQSRSCLSSAIQFFKHPENMDNRLYFIFQFCNYILFLKILYLHINEKDHENHEEMLRLEISSVFYNFFMTTIQIKKTIFQNYRQANVLPLASMPAGNYQAIRSLT